MLVVVVVFFTSHPKWSYIMMCIGYLVYFNWKIGYPDEEGGWLMCGEYRLKGGGPKPDEDDECTASWLAYQAEVWQIVGETTFVLCSLYFANNPVEDERELPADSFSARAANELQTEQVSGRAQRAVFGT